jgi:osmoprotectant transport system ATP-binding protein
VDPVVRSELHEFFLGLQRELSKTIILITHDIDEAIKLGDQVAILRIGGHLAQVGTPLELLDEPADSFVEGFVGRDRGFRSLSFQPASEVSLEGVKVVRDVETATGAAPILVVDGDARPVGWADPDRPGRVFPLGATFSPETDTLRTALDSALTSPYGLAVAVTADTQRYAGVVSAHAILAKVKNVRVSIAESISIREAEEAQAYEIREAEEAQAYEPLPEAEGEYEPLGEPEQAYDSEGVYDQQAEAEQAPLSEQVYDQQAEAEQAPLSEQVYDQMAEPDPASQADSNETGPQESQADAPTSPDGAVEPADDTEPTIADHRIPDEQDEGREADGEARYRRGSSVFP